MLSSARRKKQCHLPEDYKRLSLVELRSEKEFSKLCRMNSDLEACLDAKTTQIKEFHGPVQDSNETHLPWCFLEKSNDYIL